MADHFFNIADLAQGLPRKLADGVATRIFFGDKVMMSIVKIEPGAQGKPHAHPEEQWGLVLEGSGVRHQDGVDHEVKVGDFWLTPGGMTHGFRAGPKGVTILDVFSPPRLAYKTPGEGFGD
jgi:quercetin dioxygenase-like cupin family protein